MQKAELDYGQEPQLTRLPLECLSVDKRYQRKISAAGRRNIQNIADHFKWSMFGIVLVTDNGDGTYSILDGQHRVEALRKIDGINTAPCSVVPELTLKEQSAVFHAINVNRTPLNPLQRYNAMLRAGNEDAVHMNTMLENVGFTVPVNNFSSKTERPYGTVTCITNLLKFMRTDPEALRDSLQAIADAYDGNTEGAKTAIFDAAFHTIRSGVDRSTLTIIMKKHDPLVWSEEIAPHDRTDNTSIATTLKHLWINEATKEETL